MKILSNLLLLVLASTFLLAIEVLAHVDGNDEDLVIDAPWRTVRDYVPVMLFLPDFNPVYNRLISFRVYNYDTKTGQKVLVFEDGVDEDQDKYICNGLTFLSADGGPRGDLGPQDDFRDFWHYITRIPTSCLGRGDKRGKPGVHYLWAEIDRVKRIPSQQSPAISAVEIKKTDKHTFRVVVSKKQFPKFSPIDQYYDVHVHTIAEQTVWSVSNLNAANKAFGGPLAMLMESAYALGLTDIQLTNGNWADFKNQIVTTDHNNFFSLPPYDSGAEPDFGPTSKTDGDDEEFHWYRENLGRLGGEEATIRGAKGIDKENPFYKQKKMTDYQRKGSHFLVYGAPHFEGPWHGGEFDAEYEGVDIKPGEEGVKNPLSITDILLAMGSTDGFGYASHPESSGLGWSEDYYRRAIGLIYSQEYYEIERDISLTKTTFKRHDKRKYRDYRDGSRNSPILQKNGKDFVFKGLQIWNEHTDRFSRKNLNGEKVEDSETHNFTPHKIGRSGQTFEYKPGWDKEHNATEDKYRELMAEGLDYAFKNNSNRRFIRKLYMSAGTDAHGDFNYSLSGENTAEAEFKATVYFDADHVTASNNAFGRFRTYALTSQRFISPGATRPGGPCYKTFPFCEGVPAPKDHSVKAYEEGNTVLTDGPIATMSADANCRFNSKTLEYHDGSCVWENYDGLIGGRGNFDGGNTMLAPQTNNDVYIKYYWEGRNDYLADDNQSNNMDLQLLQIYGSGRNNESDSFKAKPRYFDHIEPINDLFIGTNENKSSKEFLNSALILKGTLRKRHDDTKFITNPIWSSPYTIEVDAPASCPFKPETLKVTVKFALSMDELRPSISNLSTHSMIKSGAVTPQKKSAWRRLSDSYKPENVNAGNDKVRDSSSPKRGHTYDGIRVIIKPLMRNGKSGETEFLISNANDKWEPHMITLKTDPGNDVGGLEKIIEDGQLTATNDMEIPCGGQWDADKHIAGKDRTSYAVIVSDILDMNRNFLNPIASTFTAHKKSLPRPDNVSPVTEGAEMAPESSSKPPSLVVEPMPPVPPKVRDHRGGSNVSRRLQRSEGSTFKGEKVPARRGRPPETGFKE